MARGECLAWWCCVYLILGWLPCRAQDHISIVPPAGIEMGGWIGRQIKES
jgi:hypothetical protein